jgi:hypothetical protein
MLRNVVGCLIPDVSKALDPSKRRELLNNTVSIPEHLNLLRCADLLVYRNEVETTVPCIRKCPVRIWTDVRHLVTDFSACR